MDMLEKAARALCDWQEPGRYDALANESPYSSGIKQEHFRKMARAVLEAVREPSEEMLHAAFVAMNDTPSGTWKRMKAEKRKPEEIFRAKMLPRYRAMLDALLGKE